MSNEAIVLMAPGSRLVEPDQLPPLDVTEAMLWGLGVLAPVQSAYVAALVAQSGDDGPYTTSLGQMAADCRGRGHGLRVCSVAAPVIWLEHVGYPGPDN